MEKTIDYLEQTGLYLLRLSRVCCALSCAQDAESRPSAITIAESYNALCDILEAKAKEIDAVVSEYTSLGPRVRPKPREDRRETTMLKDYEYGPVMPPYICCDGRFAKKYGIVEAILFNFLYHDFIVRSQMKRYGGWHKEDGWMEDGGRLWRCHSDQTIYGWFAGIFSEQQHKDAIKNLCDRGLLIVRPSATDGYYWISIGEESEGA